MIIEPKLNCFFATLQEVKRISACNPKLRFRSRFNIAAECLIRHSCISRDNYKRYRSSSRNYSEISKRNFSYDDEEN